MTALTLALLSAACGGSDEKKGMNDSAEGSGQSLSSATPTTSSPTAGASPAGSASAAITPTATVSGTASASPMGSSSAAGVTKLVAIPSHTVEGGKLSNGKTHLSKYSLRRDNGDQGKDILTAWGACASKSMVLCTESQWEHAAASVPDLVGFETWTSTADGTGFVVRGGSLTARKIVPGKEIVADRAGVCCDPTPAITSDNTNTAFMMSTAEKIVKYETALNKHTSSAVIAMYGAKPNFLGKDMENAALGKQFDGLFKQYPDLWMHEDTCDAKTEKKGADVTLVVECNTTAQRNHTLALVRNRFTFGKDKLEKYEEPKLIRGYTAP